MKKPAREDIQYDESVSADVHKSILNDGQIKKCYRSEPHGEKMKVFFKENKSEKEKRRTKRQI